MELTKEEKEQLKKNREKIALAIMVQSGEFSIEDVYLSDYFETYRYDKIFSKFCPSLVEKIGDELEDESDFDELENILTERSFDVYKVKESDFAELVESDELKEKKVEFLMRASGIDPDCTNDTEMYELIVEEGLFDKALKKVENR